ncbi:MAG: ABC transporter ATP-binding protein [Pseudomonadota bacterium]
MIKRVADLFVYMMRLTKGRLGIAMGLNLFATLTEGISLFLLIPLVLLIDQAGESTLTEIPLIGETLVRLNPSLEVLLVGFVALIIFQAVIVRVKSIYLLQTVLKAIETMRLRYFAHAGGARWDVLQNARVSDLHNMITREASRVQVALQSLTTLLQSGILLLTYFLLAAIVSLPMALVAAGFGLVILVILLPLRRRATRYGHEMTELYQGENQTLLDFLTGLKVAKSFVVEDSYALRFAAQLRALRTSMIGLVRLTSVSTMAFQVLSACAAVSFIWVAVQIVQIELANLIVLLLIFIRLAPRFNAIQEALQSLLANLPAYENMRAQTRYYQQQAEPRQGEGQVAPHFAGSIRFDRVSLTYPGADRPALDAVSFEIVEGRFTALIGPSGSGKSTVSDLLMGLLRPSEGTIFIDDEPLTDANRRAWRGSIAFVPQEPFLMNDTVASNLRIAKPDASDEDLWEVLGRAKASGFMEALPNGLETIVGERGTRFSGGERQRIALARALLRKPSLLILDEATSALDWENQKDIARDIEGMRGELTILTIAHRPSMIRFADDVIAMEAGKVTEQKAYEALLRDPDSRLSQMLKGEQAEVG